MSKPVIANRVGGVPEIILENRSWWTINNDDVNAWVERIESVVTDHQLNRTLGQSGQEWLSKRFGWATIAKQVEEILISETCRST
jgi:glycosyltransferase involved in cell wall biosynthesis